jgi:tRNA-2-methylthio-N6-dimethylallyladenosine synthase
LTTILTGCVLEQDKKRLSKKFDFVFNIKKLAELEKFLHKKNEYTSENYFDTLPKYTTPYQAFVPIMTGCNNFCSYCAVPYARGREQSRTVVEILAEIKKLAVFGCKEITLLGQNVNSFEPEDGASFSKDNPFTHSFAKLIWEVNQITGLERITFSSAHPKDMHDEVIATFALPKMMNYLHLALQSGDDVVLERMNRKYKASDYLKIIEKLRAVRPEIALGTDFIVGFPGETREQFENTLKIYKKIRFDIAYPAMYSARTGTEAANFADTVSREEKKKRWHEVQDLMEGITFEINQKYKGQTVSVLIDNVEETWCEGNSSEMKRVRIYDQAHKVGEIVRVRVKEAKMWILEAGGTGETGGTCETGGTGE